MRSADCGIWNRKSKLEPPRVGCCEGSAPPRPGPTMGLSLSHPPTFPLSCLPLLLRFGRLAPALLAAAGGHDRSGEHAHGEEGEIHQRGRLLEDLGHDGRKGEIPRAPVV